MVPKRRPPNPDSPDAGSTPSGTGTSRRRPRTTAARSSEVQPKARRQTAQAPGAALPSVVRAVETFLRTLDLDEMGDAKAAIARALALKLDKTQHSTVGIEAQAVASIAKELRAVLDEIRDATSDASEFAAGLFSEVGDR
jgi:hypothetical protein